MVRFTTEQKAAYVAEKRESFLSGSKTSTPEYIEKFNAMSVEEQFAAIRRQETYNERKANGETSKKVVKSSNPLNMLINGEKPELSTEAAEILIEKFTNAITLMKEIIEDNKNREKEELQEQIKALQERLKQIK